MHVILVAFIKVCIRALLLRSEDPHYGAKRGIRLGSTVRAGAGWYCYPTSSRAVFERL